MTFISYAQNFEDVMLHRALKHIEKGVYVDVGANDPTYNSVTCAFYRMGWRGINIEPSPDCMEKIRAQRPEDTNLELAASFENGRVDLYECDVRGLSTVQKRVAEKLEQQDHEMVQRQVSSKTLDSVFDEYGIETVHFLKVDVEGHEKQVIQGASLKKVRPWIILIEATAPNTPVPTHESWEDLLLEKGYLFVYFDGLNRFYVAEEHTELIGSFSCPPNVFDEFDFARLIDLRESLEEQKGYAAHIESSFQQFQGLLSRFLEVSNPAFSRDEQAFEDLMHIEENASESESAISTNVLPAMEEFDECIQTLNLNLEKEREKNRCILQDLEHAQAQIEDEKANLLKAISGIEMRLEAANKETEELKERLNCVEADKHAQIRALKEHKGKGKKENEDLEGKFREASSAALQSIGMVNSLQASLSQLNAALEQQNQTTNHMASMLAAKNHEIERLQGELSEALNHKLLAVIKPIRFLCVSVRSPRDSLVKVCRFLYSKLETYPRLNSVFQSALNRFPAVRQYLRSKFYVKPPKVGTPYALLPLRAQKLYLELRKY